MQCAGRLFNYCWLVHGHLGNQQRKAIYYGNTFWASHSQRSATHQDEPPRTHLRGTVLFYMQGAWLGKMHRASILFFSYFQIYVGTATRGSLVYIIWDDKVLYFYGEKTNKDYKVLCIACSTLTDVFDCLGPVHFTWFLLNWCYICWINFFYWTDFLLHSLLIFTELTYFNWSKVIFACLNLFLLKRFYIWWTELF